MSVHEIKRTSLMNAPQRLRELADEMERRGEAFTAIVVIGYPNGSVAIRGYGPRTSALEATGWLLRAQTTMTEGAGLEDNWSSPDTA